MKALVKLRPEKGIWLEDIPMPHVGINDVLIKINKTAICGTDLHIYKWDDWSQRTIKTPMTIGHEYVGEIVDKGRGVKNIQIGDRVTGEGHIACGHCRNCRRGKLHVCENTIGVGVNRDGAFAEYLSLPAENVVHLDTRISDEIAAIMDPFGNATHTALSFPMIGEDVLITGAGLKELLQLLFVNLPEHAILLLQILVIIVWKLQKKWEQLLLLIPLKEKVSKALLNS